MDKATGKVFYEDNAVPLSLKTVSVKVPANTVVYLWTNAGAIEFHGIEPQNTHYEQEWANTIYVYTKDLDCTVNVYIPR